MQSIRRSLIVLWCFAPNDGVEGNFKEPPFVQRLVGVPSVRERQLVRPALSKCQYITAELSVVGLAIQFSLQSIACSHRWWTTQEGPSFNHLKQQASVVIPSYIDTLAEKKRCLQAKGLWHVNRSRECHAGKVI